MSDSVVNMVMVVKRAFTVGVLLSALVLGNNAFADATIVFKDMGTGETVSPMMIRDGQVRIAGPAIGGDTVLFDSKTSSLTHINNKNKSYMVMDRAAMDMIANTVAIMQQSVIANMKGLTPEKEAQMKAMMSQMMGQSINANSQTTREFRKTKIVKEVGSYKCTVIENIKQGIKTSDVCVVDLKDTTLSGEDFKSLKAFFDFVKTIANKIPGGEKMKEEFGFWESDVNVVPVQVTRYENGKVKSVHQIEEIITKSIDSAGFDVPADYKRRSLIPGV